MRKKRRHFTSSEKVALIKRHLIDHTPVYELCDEHSLQLSVFYKWMKQFFENGALAFENGGGVGKKSSEERRIQELEAKLTRKHEVFSKLMEEHVKVKKDLGVL